MIVTREKVYWLVMVDYKYEFAEEEKNCILWQSELIRVVSEVCVVKGGKAVESTCCGGKASWNDGDFIWCCCCRMFGTIWRTTSFIV